jgi:hypothetical protein
MVQVDRALACLVIECLNQARREAKIHEVKLGRTDVLAHHVNRPIARGTKADFTGWVAGQK